MYKYTIFKNRPFSHSMPFCSTILDIQHTEIKLKILLVLPKKDPSSGPQTTFRVPLPFWAPEWSDTKIFNKILFSWEKHEQENLQKTITGIWLKKFCARLCFPPHISATGRVRGILQLPRREEMRRLTLGDVLGHSAVVPEHTNSTIPWVSPCPEQPSEAPSNPNKSKKQIMKSALNILTEKKAWKYSVLSPKILEDLGIRYRWKSSKLYPALKSLYSALKWASYQAASPYTFYLQIFITVEGSVYN